MVFANNWMQELRFFDWSLDIFRSWIGLVMINWEEKPDTKLIDTKLIRWVGRRNLWSRVLNFGLLQYKHEFFSKRYFFFHQESMISSGFYWLQKVRKVVFIALGLGKGNVHWVSISRNTWTSTTLGKCVDLVLGWDNIGSDWKNWGNVNVVRERGKILIFWPILIG